MVLAWVLRVALAAAAPAQPQPPRLPATVELEWNAPQGCASVDQVLARMRALLSGPPTGQGEARVVADIEVGTGTVHMTLTTVFQGQTDRREVESTSCATLAETTAVLLAVSLEPGLEPAADPEPAAGPKAPMVPHAPQVVPDPGRASDRDPRPRTPMVVKREDTAEALPSMEDTSQPRRSLEVRVLGFVAAEAGAEWGALDALSLASRISLGVRATAWNAQVHGTYLSPRRRPGGLYQLGTVGARGCWTPGSGPWLAQLCAGGEIGGLRVDTRGIDPAGDALGPYAGPAGTVGLVRRSAAVEWLFGAEVVARAWGSRTRHAGPGSAVLTEQRPVSLRLTTGIRFSFFPSG